MTILNTLEQVAGQLAVSASTANDLTVNVYAGRANTVEELPCVILSGETCEQFIYQSGIYRCNLMIQVQEKASDTATTSNVSQVIYDAFAEANTNAQLNSLASGSLYIYESDVKDFRNAVGTDDKTWVQEMNLEIICGLLT